jgi:hypothetical protein
VYNLQIGCVQLPQINPGCQNRNSSPLKPCRKAFQFRGNSGTFRLCDWKFSKSLLPLPRHFASSLHLLCPPPCAPLLSSSALLLCPLLTSALTSALPLLPSALPSAPLCPPLGLCSPLLCSSLPSPPSVLLLSLPSYLLFFSALELIHYYIHVFKYNRIKQKFKTNENLIIFYAGPWLGPRLELGGTQTPSKPYEKSVSQGLTKNLEKMPRSTEIKSLGSQAFF